MPIYVFPSLLSGCFLLGLGIFILTRNAKSLINISFAIALFGASIVAVSHFFLLLTKSFFWIRAVHLGTCLIPGSLAIFSLTFSREAYQESLRQWKWVIAGILGGSVWFLYLGLSGTLVTKTSQLSFNRFEIYKLQQPGMYFFLFLILSIIFILHNLENTYRNASSEVRWKIKYLILGIFSASFFDIFLISYMLLYRIVRVEYFVAEAVVMIISGFFVAFSLVRHRLMDTDVFISRQVVYNSFVLFAAGSYLITIAVIGYLVKYHFIQQQVTQFLVAEVFMYVALIGMALLLLSESIRRRIELYISKHFYKHKYEYDEVWIAFTRQIGSNVNIDRLLPQLRHSIQEIVNTDRVFIFLHDEATNRLVLKESSLAPPKSFAIPMESEFVNYFQHTSMPIMDVNDFKTTESLQAMYIEQKEMFESLEIFLCAPLRIKHTFMGIIAIGAERMQEPYTQEDYDLLYTIGIQAASAILNAKLTENLSQARALETFHKFAAFILHDLKNAVQNLSFVVQNAPDYFDEPEFREDAIKTISDTVTRMNTMIARLSSVPEKLDLHITAVRVDRFLEDTLKKSKVSKMNHLEVQIDISDPSLVVSLDYHYFQSVLINLLSNAAEAITADQGKILVRVLHLEHIVEFSVSDNGGGISQERITSLFTPFKSTKKKGLGIGLYQCKTIVEAHKGKIYVESEEGRGTTFRIELPLMNREELG